MKKVHQSFEKIKFKNPLYQIQVSLYEIHFTFYLSRVQVVFKFKINLFSFKSYFKIEKGNLKIDSILQYSSTTGLEDVDIHNLNQIPFLNLL